MSEKQSDRDEKPDEGISVSKEMTTEEIQAAAGQLAEKVEDLAVRIASLREQLGTEEGLGTKTPGMTADDFPLTAALLNVEQSIELLRRAATVTEESLKEEWLRRKAAREAAGED